MAKSKNREKNNYTTTKNTAKKRATTLPTISLVNISEQDKRRLHGEQFELEIDLALLKSGIGCEKLSVNSVNDGTVISDHCFENYWMESTTWFDKKRIDEFNKKKKIVTENSTIYNKFILFVERILTKKQKTLVKELIKNGWLIVDGSEKIEAFIDMLSNKNKSIVDGKIRVGKPELIDRKLLLENEFNRDQKPKGVLSIAKSIVKHGFLTGLFVIPTYKNGKLIGYTLFEGHHRLAAINLVNEWGHSLEKVPCIIVDWLTSDELEEVGKLLIKINVEYKKWELIDYIKLYYKLFTKLKFTDKAYSYERLVELRKIAPINGFTENFLIYIFGKTTGSTLHLDKDCIQNGEFSMDKNEYENYTIPFMEALKKPYATAYAKKKFVANVYQYLCKRLYAEFKSGKLTLLDVKMWLGAYNYLDTNDIPTKTEELKQIWDNKLLDRVGEVRDLFV